MGMREIILALFFAIIFGINAEKSICVKCAKTKPVCNCASTQDCIIYAQTCERCAYAECIDKIIKIDYNPGLDKIHIKSRKEFFLSPRKTPQGIQDLPPIPADLIDISKGYSGDIPTQEDDNDCLMCIQTIPRCSCPNDSKCRVMKQTCHQCSWTACIDSRSSCIINCPTKVDLCKNCHVQKMQCLIKQPINCQECGTVICQKNAV
jgi:Opy2 protein